MSEMSISMHVHDKTEIEKHEGEGDNIATIQASTVSQQVHATRAREAQARTRRAWEVRARSAQAHAGAFGCMLRGETRGDVGDGDERSPQGPVMSTTFARVDHPLFERPIQERKPLLGRLVRP